MARGTVQIGPSPKQVWRWWNAGPFTTGDAIFTLAFAVVALSVMGVLITCGVRAFLGF